MFDDTYTTGVDMQAYVGPPTLPFYNELELLEPLDVQSITIMEEGGAIPLYNYFEFLPNRTAFATRLVTGALHFNFSEDFVRTYRVRSRLRDGFQWLRGGTIYVVMRKIEYAARRSDGSLGPRIVREVVRLNQVWESPFQHAPEPSASEVVPFVAHSVTLVERQHADVNSRRVLEFVDDPERFETSTEDPLLIFSDDPLLQQLYKTRAHKAIITKVVDGDTFKAEIEGVPGTIEIRLIGADAPETPKGYRGKGENNTKVNSPASWVWPEPTWLDITAGTKHPNSGQAPSAEQLDAWGIYVTERVDAWFPKDEEGRMYAYLVVDPSIRPVDEYGRYLFQVRHPDTNEALDEYLIKNGWATPFNYPTGIFDGTVLTDRRAALRRLYQSAWEKAGTPEAKGIWASFTPPA